ncbi:hypothetical protein [Vibrio phage vB_VmeM-Yong XC32]|nr:hypothetical protein [Vibrio phage vB_VmeM-Yong XC31]QAX96420.1 hypothetical protein [Vibrio phage vB_VmeM-Yong XC32]QAX96737.1 hypothetical protein [Vibrio phage vB_VmeM-Yong MS31]QAX97056.1 hypothetical protein [Vibrio phage vB_VmeM-Yong MS32]
MSLKFLHPDADTFNQWLISQMYLEGSPDDRAYWVPNVDDMVVDWSRGMYRVVSVTDNRPTLEFVSPFSQDSRFNIDSTSLITGVSSYQPNAANKIFIDKSNGAPYTVEVDGKYTLFGSGPVKMVFFRGTDTSADGEVISEVYNGSGVLTGIEIPLTDLNAAGTQKRPVQFKTTKELDAGEVITGVSFTGTGQRYSEQTFLAFESAGFRPQDATTKYIDRVSLKSDLISSSETDLILNTIGTPISSALFKGVLHYNNGDSVEMNIDGTKMVLDGVVGFDTSYAGRPRNVVLKYYPGANEPFINGSIGVTPVVSAIYRLANVVRGDSFALKVFIVPEWDSANTRYNFRYWVINLDGDLLTEVTSDVTAVRNSDGQPIAGTDFTNEQEISLSLDMETVSPSVYAGYVHTQTFKITVDQPGAISGQKWLLDYVGDGSNVYGQDLAASTNLGGTELNVGLGEAVQATWLTKLYRSAEPLYDPAVLTEAPTPTHFTVMYDGAETAKISVNDYFSNIALPGGMTNWADGKTALVRFILETPGGDKTLALSPLYINPDLT